MDDVEVRAKIGELEHLLEGIEGDPAATAAVQGIVEIYGEALRRIVAGVGGEPLAGDELVSHLLLLHDLHPEDVESRVGRALAEVRPYLGSHGGDIELLGVADGVARVRLAGTCNGCPSSTATLTRAVEQAIRRAAPELERIDAEGAVAPPEPQLVQLRPLTCPTELQAT
jgi:Fe-S cluster biogenesis protein NfuA